MATKTDRLLFPDKHPRRRGGGASNSGPERVTASGKGRLRPRARLIRTIGAELISSEVVAILELVRNSYDADATLVQLVFRNPYTDEAELEIIDDGHGMSRDILLGPWLEPATAFKTGGSNDPMAGDRSPLGRRRLGSKGVGRFATQRLGRHLVLRTSQSGPTEVRAEFDWIALDRADAFLDQLRIPWREMRTTPRRRWKGTSLLIRGLREIWTGERFDRLRLALSRLLGPGLGADPPFRIDLVINDVHEPIEPALEALTPMYSVAGEVRSSGLAVMRYTDLSGVTEQWERSVQWPPVGVACGPFSFEVKAWDLDKPALIPFLQKTGIAHGLRDFRRLIREHSGVSLYRDGFRILPYGEPDNDWLRLDRRRVNNPTVRLSNNQILGWVKVSAERNPLLQDQTNREGLVNNEAYVHLQHVVMELLTHLEHRRFSARRSLGVGVTAPLRRPTPTLMFDRPTEAAPIAANPEVLRLAAVGHLSVLVQQRVSHLHRQLATELDLLQHELPGLWGGDELHTAVLPTVQRARERLAGLVNTSALLARLQMPRERSGDRPAAASESIARVFELFAERIARLEVVVSARVDGQVVASGQVLSVEMEPLLGLVISGVLDVLETCRKPRRLDVASSDSGISVLCSAPDTLDPTVVERSFGVALAGQAASDRSVHVERRTEGIEVLLLRDDGQSHAAIP
jgi:hypothetical protein